ncbi:polysaccharide deacetylase family protein [Candidatus Fermentibacteria bacterium]|nr:polysaccharide deacetylase family protein [Candidatus Fermentibacteria bacterium]
MIPYFALRIDVETATGLMLGLPSMLRILASRGVRATVMMPMGPDRSGLALARIIGKPHRLRQMLRLRPAGASIVSAFMAGIAVPVRSMAAAARVARPMVFGHELALHGHDHWLWIHRCRAWPLERVDLEVRRGQAAFAAALGERAKAFAAPGWIVTPETLAAVDKAGFLYASDCRGSTPFLPDGMHTPQLPVTLPTAEETVRAGQSLKILTNRVAREVTCREYSCYCAHAEVEGLRFPDLLSRLLDIVQAVARVGTLSDAMALQASLPVCPVVQIPLAGRFDTVASQGVA